MWEKVDNSVNEGKRFFSLKSKILFATVIPVIMVFAFLFSFAFVSYNAFSEEIAKMGHKIYKPDFLSMGMTNDYDIAIEEGADIVRIGTALFS